MESNKNSSKKMSKKVATRNSGAITSKENRVGLGTWNSAAVVGDGSLSVLSVLLSVSTAHWLEDMTSCSLLPEISTLRLLIINAVFFHTMGRPAWTITQLQHAFDYHRHFSHTGFCGYSGRVTTIILWHLAAAQLPDRRSNMTGWQH